MVKFRVYVVTLVLLAGCERGPKDPYTYFRGTAMTLPYNVAVAKTLTRLEKKQVEKILDATFGEVDATFNNWNGASEISRINAATKDEWISVSKRMEGMLAFCDKIVSLSGGRFDPTVEPLARLWRESLREKKTPATVDLQAACDALGWSRLQIHNRQIKKDEAQIRLDLCSVAKGICIDWIAERLKAIGIADFFIEWSGEFRTSGKRCDGNDWTVQVHPALTQNGRALPPILLKDAALSISGNFPAKGWILPADASPDGQVHRFIPVIDPSTAQPLEKTRYSIAFAAVIAPSCALADALATAAMIFPSRKDAENWAQEVVELYPEVSFWILSYDDKR